MARIGRPRIFCLRNFGTVCVAGVLCWSYVLMTPGISGASDVTVISGSSYGFDVPEYIAVNGANVWVTNTPMDLP